MKHKLHTPEQIVNKLRQADAAIASGGTIEILFTLHACPGGEMQALLLNNPHSPSRI